jgi:hypothetical protein
VSSSVYNLIDRLNYNFAYLCSRCTLASNVLPSKFKGYYSNTGGTDGLPIFQERLDSNFTVPPTAYDTGGVVAIDTTVPKLSTTQNGEELNNLVIIMVF